MRAAILVGHGGVPTDCPPELVSAFKRAEAAAKGRPTPELVEADRKLRDWPRDGKNDLYQVGLEDVGRALQAALPDHKVYLAYNEFCAPSLEEAIESAVKDGAKTISIVTTMFTRGGMHSECEIPGIAMAEAKKHPGVTIRYSWPFDLPQVGAFLAHHVRAIEP